MGLLDTLCFKEGKRAAFGSHPLVNASDFVLLCVDGASWLNFSKVSLLWFATACQSICIT